MITCRSLITTCFLTIGAFCFAQDQVVKPIEMGTLPKVINESSGLAVATKNSLWTINDRGGKAELYEVSTRGELIRTIRLLGIEPVDMEDMAQDSEGNVYIADTGNNKKDRQKLRVYSFNVADISNDSVKPSITEFVLPERALEDECHYDIEAMSYADDRLFFFTKDRCDKKNNSLHVYSIPTETGLYTAKNEGEFFWQDPEEVVRITAADISEDGKKLVLLANDALHFFFAYNKTEFFNGSYFYMALNKSKKEAVVHMDDCDLYISEESTKGELAKIWKLNLCQMKFD